MEKLYLFATSPLYFLPERRNSLDTNYAVEMRNITKTFGKIVANSNVTLNIRKGEILSLLGENGSGKTTIVAALSFVLITILRPLMTAVAVYYLDWGIVGVWVAICLDQILRSGCFTYILYQIKALPTMPAKA